MRGCGPRDSSVDAFSTASGSAPPFLPTLTVAIVLALVSLLCRTPSAPEAPALAVAAAQVSPAGGDGFHPALTASETTPAIPAALAFARLHPMMLQAPHLADAGETAKAPASRAAARTAAVIRRPCTGPRCGETRRAETALRNPPAPVKAASEPLAVPEPMRGEAESDEGLLPTGALPFAATAASLVESARKIGGSVGGGAASLGGSVMDLLASAP